MTELLKKEFGPHVVSDEAAEVEKKQVFGKAANVVFYPENVETISKLMAYANRDDKKLLVVGNNSQHHFGAAIEKTDWVISLEKMNAVIEHDVADLIVTVQAGTGLAQLQNHLTKSGQFLPLDSSYSLHQTLGGIVATNSLSSWQPAYGNCRDLVLGMKMILPDGSVVRAGGKTVKNVAGYDLSKFFIGTMGTLGIIAEVTFKLFPRPMSSQTVFASFENVSDAFSLVKTISSSNLVVSRYEYVNSAYYETSVGKRLSHEHNLLLNVAGHTKMVKQTSQIIENMAKQYHIKKYESISGDEEQNLWRFITGPQVSSAVSSELILQIAVPKSQQPKLISEIQSMCQEYQISPLIRAHAFNGIIYIYFMGNPGKPDFHYSPVIERLRRKARDHGGNLIVRKSVAGLSNDLVWGSPGEEIDIMKKIKTKYDPNNVMVSGRFVGGL